MMPPPSFVIRNSVHTTTTDDIVVGVPPIDGHAGEDGVKQIGDVVESSMSIRPPSVPVVVQLVQATEGAYMLDFDFANDTLIANIISKKDEDNPNNDETYIDEEAWEHLLAYSELVGKPISIDKNELEVKHPHNVVSPALSTNASSFVLLKDVAKEVTHTLLDAGRLFAWHVAIDAINEGKLQWKDIRSYLSIVRKCIPFATQCDGLPRPDANTITFYQFVVLARMMERQIESFVPILEVPEPDANMSDIFPPFDSISQTEMEIELLASIRDREVQNNAKASGLAIPTSALDLEDCSEEWRRYVQWWSTSCDARYGFCMRELVFAEEDAEVQRNALESGISEHGTLNNSLISGKNLRRFGSWYYGSGKDPKFNVTSGESKYPKPDRATRASFYLGDSHTSSLVRPSASSMEELHTVEACPKDPIVCILSENSHTVASAERELIPSPIHPHRSDQVASVESSSKGGISSEISSATEIISIVGSKIVPAEKSVSMRYRLLRRATLQYDTLKLLFNKKKGPKLRGIKLLQSKVRLVVLMRRFLGISPSQLPAVAPDSLDIFSRLCYSKHSKASPSCGREHKELLAKAIVHRNQMLRRKIVKNWMSWKRQVSVERQRHELALQKAIAAHQRTVTLRCFRELRAHSTRQTMNRESSVSASTTSKPRTEIHSPSSIDDEPPFLVNELAGMELVVGRNRPSGIDVLIGDFVGYQDIVHVQRIHTQQPPPARTTRFRLLDEATLQRMKREKLAGASNLFDVPLEIIHSSSQSDMNDVE